MHAEDPAAGLFMPLESKPECRQDEGRLIEFPMP
jgi:hypothetical protein